MRRPHLALLGVLAFAVVVLAIPVGRTPVWEMNDARYVLMAQDMIEQGHWLVPEIRSERHEGLRHEGLFKPQLYVWSIALASLPSGHVSERSAAIPSVVSAIAGVMGVFAIASLLWSPRAGVLAGLILTTTPSYFAFARRPLADVMMTAFMVWALYFLLRARRDWALAPLLGFYACVGGATLSKGVPGLAPLVAAGVVISVGDGPRALHKLRPGWGTVVLVILLLPWLVPYLSEARHAFIHEVLIEEHAVWFFQKHGLAYRLAHMPSVLVYFLPWTLYLPAAVVWWRRSERDEGRRGVLWWTATLWVLVGLSGIYRDRYYLPIYPGLALLTANFFAAVPAPAARREWRLGSVAVVILTIAAATLIAFPLRLSGEGPVYLPDLPWERMLIAGLLVGGAAGVAFVTRHGALVGAALVIAVMLGGVLAVEARTSPARRARYYDVRTIGTVATAHTPADGVVLGYPGLSLEYDVYIGRRIKNIRSAEELVPILARPPRDTLILTSDDWAALVGIAAPSWHVLTTRTVGDRRIVVVGASRP